MPRAEAGPPIKEILFLRCLSIELFEFVSLIAVKIESSMNSDKVNLIVGSIFPE